MLLEAKQVTKKFGDLTVLDDVSLAVSAGDFVSIVGKSGSGKSTLLTILGGIDRPTEGEVSLNGENISKQKEKELAKLRRTKLGFVFQFFNLAPYLTARENILLPIVLNGKTEKSAERKLRELTDYLGISELLDKLPAKMSGGEQQRVAIARGLIFEPELILLDEPTGNLDSKTSEEIMRLLARINRDVGTTVVQVTHSAHNAAYGNRIVEIVDGRIAFDRNAEAPGSAKKNSEFSRERGATESIADRSGSKVGSKEEQSESSLEKVVEGSNVDRSAEAFGIAEESSRESSVGDVSEITAKPTESLREQGAAETIVKRSAEAEGAEPGKDAESADVGKDADR